MATNWDTTGEDNEWYRKPIFSSFWKHYKHCNQWLERNGYKVIEFSDHFNDCNHNYNQSTHEYSSHMFGTNSTGAQYTARPVETIGPKCAKMDALEAIDENECNLLYDKSEELFGLDEKEVLDISEDYLKFVMETKRHQNERKKLREKRLRYDSRVEYVDISRVDSFARRAVAPKRSDRTEKSTANEKNQRTDRTDRSGKHIVSAHELKREKMFELYGEDYNVIQGMEAALQLNFDRLCDINQPKFWPVMPIRMPSKSPFSS